MWSARNGEGDSGGVSGNNTALETVNAAAAAIAAVENRASQVTSVRRRRWGGCWSLYWCFGCRKNQKRTRHAVVIPETSNPRAYVPAAQSQTQTTAIILPFVAPPSSPASSFQSEPPSITQSPASISTSMYSHGARQSIFGIGPYAHETQLVSPPAFSAFTTEPSTGPVTPPSEPVQLTTPSSPEVPFAQLLDPNPTNTDAFLRFPFSPHEFPSYHLTPGSPVGHLISPSSAFSVSGTSSPFAGCELPAIPPNFLNFLVNKSPENRSAPEWGSRSLSGSSTPGTTRPLSQDGCLQDSKDAPHLQLLEERLNDDCVGDSQDLHELPSLELERGGEVEPIALAMDAIKDESKCHVPETSTCTAAEVPANHEKIRQHWRYRSISLGSLRDFKLSKADEQDVANKHKTGSTSFTNVKVFNEDNKATKDWSFLHMIHPVDN